MKKSRFLPCKFALACALILSAASPSFAAGYFAIFPAGGPDPLQAQRPVHLVLNPAPAQLLYTGDPYSLNLVSLLSLDGPTGTSASNVVWSASGLPAGLTLSGGVISGTPLVASPPVTVAVGAVYPSNSGPVQADGSYQFEVQVGHGSQLYLSTGSFVAPKTGTYDIYVVGGGGGGGAGNYGFSEWVGGPVPLYRDAAGAGGGAAAVPRHVTQTLTRGQSYSVSIAGGGGASSFNGAIAGPGASGASPSGTAPCCGYGTRSGYQRNPGAPGAAGADSLLPQANVATRAGSGASAGSYGGTGGLGCGAGGGGGSGGTSTHSDIWYGAPGGGGGAGAPGCMLITW